MITRKKVSVAFGVLLGAAVAILWMNPFAGRYQGKTLNEWIDQAVNEDDIRSDVVLAFGKESIPDLLAARNRWHWIWALANKVSFTTGKNVERSFQIKNRAYKVYDWLALLRTEFSRPIPIDNLVATGNSSPDDAAQTLLSYFNATEKDTTALRVVLFQTREDLESLIQRDDFTARLFGSLIENGDQISTVQFGPADHFGTTSDQVVRVRINYRDSSSRIKTIVFKRTPLPGGDRWNARINIRKDATGKLKTTFAPIEPHPFRLN